MSEKFREFWITKSIHSGEIRDVIQSNTKFVGYRNIHVIEYAALKAEKQKAQELVKAMQFILKITGGSFEISAKSLIKHTLKKYEASDE